MVAEGLWRSKKRPGARVHQSRPRRPALGELVQIDGSPHAWFEDRGPRCTLIVFIDDATSRLMALRFAEAETTEAYMRTLRGYLDQHGRPVAIYSDKHSIFRVNQKDREGDLTQFTRMLKTLDIQPIHANTPQAKGRVERANQTLQDRLVKELRLRRIDDIQSANAFLPEFIADYNQRFSVAPKTSQNAHRNLLHDSAALNLILSLHTARKLSRNLTCRYRSREYQIQGQGHGYRLRGSTVTVCESFDGPISLLVPRQDPRLPSARSRPAAHPHRRRKKPLPYRRQGPLPPAQTPSLQTLPRPPLESLGSPPPSPFHPYPIATPASSRSSRPPLGSSASKAWPEVPFRP